MRLAFPKVHQCVKLLSVLSLSNLWNADMRQLEVCCERRPRSRRPEINVPPQHLPSAGTNPPIYRLINVESGSEVTLPTSGF